MPLKEILDRAFAERYGVAAFNIVNDLTLEAVIAAAEEERAPVIVQTSVKTVRSIGRRACSIELFRALAARRRGAGDAAPRPLPGPRRSSPTASSRAGTRCSSTPTSSTWPRTPARRSRWSPRPARYGAHVEGEIEGIQGVEDGIGSDEACELADPRESRSTSSSATGVDCFAPAIGNAHGVYSTAPDARPPAGQRPRGGDRIPMALHGGTGLTDDAVPRT